MCARLWVSLLILTSPHVSDDSFLPSVNFFSLDWNSKDQLLSAYEELLVRVIFAYVVTCFGSETLQLLLFPLILFFTSVQNDRTFVVLLIWSCYFLP